MQFKSEDHLRGYVEQEIAKALPAGWSSKRENRNPLVWQIVSDVPTSAPVECFRVRVTGDWQVFVLEHGNTDMGGLSLHHALLNAKVIDADSLDHFALSQAISDVIANCRPNQWGLT